jgi:hypothetical protein
MRKVRKNTAASAGQHEKITHCPGYRAEPLIRKSWRENVPAQRLQYLDIPSIIGDERVLRGALVVLS